MLSRGLNAPDGAGCSLTSGGVQEHAHIRSGLNAPDGAGCSLTTGSGIVVRAASARLNAPDGAGCSLTAEQSQAILHWLRVIMHLMVLGAP